MWRVPARLRAACAGWVAERERVMEVGEVGGGEKEKGKEKEKEKEKDVTHGCRGELIPDEAHDLAS